MSWNRVGVLWVGALCALLAACGDDEGSKADRSDGGDGGDGGGGLTSTGGAAGGVVGGSGGGGNVSVDVDRFADGAMWWSLPPGFDNDKMDDLAEDSGDPCIQGAFSAATMDMTGDGIPDLVVTDNCDEQGVGSTEWLVFPGGSGGFTEGMISWALPTGFDNDKMDDLGEDSGDPCIQGAFSAATVDMTGDGAPDLVVTDNCDEQGTGSTEWLIFPAVGGGA